VVVGSVQAFLRRHVVVAAVVFVTLGGTAFAMADGSLGGRAAKKSKTYYACVTERFGTLNLTTKSATCPNGERKIRFGARGRRGRVGAAGARGPAGPAGPAGAQGIKGAMGAPGAAGAKGDAGPAGAEGPQGETGATGPEGPQGETGTPGAQGLQGDPGETGPEGPQGDPGSPAASMMTSRVDIPASTNPGYRYVAISGISPLAGSRSSVTMLSPPVPIVVRDIAIDLDGPAGPTNSETHQFFLEVNGVGGAPCGMAGAVSSCTNTSAAITVPPSSRLDWTFVSTGSTPANAARLTFRATTP